MQSRFTRSLLSLAAVGALAVPAVAQARHGSDDPVGHDRQEHHAVAHHRRHHRDNDLTEHHRRGNDDGPNHR